AGRPKPGQCRPGAVRGSARRRGREPPPRRGADAAVAGTVAGDDGHAGAGPLASRPRRGRARHRERAAPRVLAPALRVLAPAAGHVERLRRKLRVNHRTAIAAKLRMVEALADDATAAARCAVPAPEGRVPESRVFG